MESDNATFFVSSTFLDMQGERDALHRIVMPRLRTFSNEHGRTLGFVDLRWGIDTDECGESEGSDKVLDVCLSSIDQCAPYMLVLLGNRYGWIPPAEKIQDAAGKKGFKISEEISVTELEIRYGTWLNENALDRCIFCFRNDRNLDCLSEADRDIYLSKSEDDAVHMKHLKDRIRSNPTARVIEYTVDYQKNTGRYDDFSDLLSAELESLLQEKWGDSPISWIKRQKMEDRRIQTELAKRFGGREDLIKDMEEFLYPSSMMILYGENGCGTTSIMSELGGRLLSGQKRVRTIYCGSGYCTDTRHLMRILCSELDNGGEEEYEQIGPSDGREDYWRDKWYRLAENYDGEDVYILIDGLHHLTHDDALISSEFLPQNGFSQKLCFVFSSNRDVPLDAFALEKTGRWCHFYQVPDVTQSDIRAIVKKRLASAQKEIGEEVYRAILEHPLSKNMICLELIIRDILEMDAADFEKIAKMQKKMSASQAITQHLCNIVKAHPAKEEDLAMHWLYRSMDILAEHDRAEFNYLCYLYVSLAFCIKGVSKEELSDMCSWLRENTSATVPYWAGFYNELRFTKMIDYLDSMIQKTVDGRYVLSHELLKSAVFTFSNVEKLVQGPMYYFLCRGNTSATKLYSMMSLVLVCISEKPEETERLFEKPVQEIKEDPSACRMMSEGLRISFQYGKHRSRMEALGRILNVYAVSGKTPDDPILNYFCKYLIEEMLRDSVHSGKIALYLIMMILSGYSTHLKIDCEKETWPKSLKHWKISDGMNLCRLYYLAVLQYDRIRFSLQEKDGASDEMPMSWTALREDATKYMNLILASSGVDRSYLNYLCAKIVLFDARKQYQSGTSGVAYFLMEARAFAKRIITSVKKKQYPNPQLAQKRYLEVIFDVATEWMQMIDEFGKDGSLKIDNREYNSFFMADYLLSEAYHLLKRKKYLKKEEDLESVYRLCYLRIKYKSKFVHEKLPDKKNEQVDLLWELYCTAINSGEYKSSRSIRMQVHKTGVALAEILLKGYVPSAVRKGDLSQKEYCRQLRRVEHNITLADYQVNCVIPQYVYEWMLIESLDTLSDPENNCSVIDAIIRYGKDNLSNWMEGSDVYIYKIRQLINTLSKYQPVDFTEKH